MTDATNPRVFGDNDDNLPSILGRYTAYQDLNEATYLQIGLTGLFGWNNSWTTLDDLIDDTLMAAVYGVDMVLMWEPTDRMRYRNVEWRSEAYFMDKEIYAPDASGA